MNKEDQLLSKMPTMLAESYTLWKGGKKKCALKKLDKLIGISPTCMHGYEIRGTILSDLGRYEDSIADFNRCIALSPTPNVYFERGRVY